MTWIGWLVAVIGPSVLYLILTFLPQARLARWGFVLTGLVLALATVVVGMAGQGILVSLAKALGWEDDAGEDYAFTYVLLLWLISAGVAFVLQAYRPQIQAMGVPAYPVVVVGAAAVLLSRAFFQ